MYMGVHLRDDRIIDVEEQMQAFKWDIDSETTVFELAAPIHGSKVTFFCLLHEDDGIEDTRYGG